MVKPPKNLGFLAICFVLVFLVYGHSLFGSFVFDDRSIVSHQTLFENLNNLPKVASMGYWTAEAGLYRPVTLITYSLNYAFFGSGAGSFHLINLILYAFTIYLLFLLIKRIFQRKLLAYLTSLLFLVLPIHTEVVANIVGRAEILALFFSLLAFLELLKRRINPWLVGLWILLAMGSKETAIAALPIAGLIIFCKYHGRLNKKILADYLPAIVLSISSVLAYLLIRFLVLGQYFLASNASLVENPLKFTSFFKRIVTALQILVLYLKKSFWPFNLCSDYSYNQIPTADSFFNPGTLLGLVILLFLVISAFAFLKRWPVLGLGSGFFIFSFLPVSNLLLPIGTIAGERLIYFPSVGLCLYLAAALICLRKLNPSWLPKTVSWDKFKQSFSWIFMVVSLGLLGFYATASLMRGLDWLTEKQLFISAARCASNSVLSRSNMGTVYYFAGQYDEAEKEILAAHQIYDKYGKAINNLGLVYWKKGQFTKAKQEYIRAIKNWPPYEGVYENIILLELSQGNTDRAEKWIRVIFIDDLVAKNLYLKKYGFK